MKLFCQSSGSVIASGSAFVYVISEDNVRLSIIQIILYDGQNIFNIKKMSAIEYKF